MSGFAWDWEFARSILPELLNGFRLTLIATLFGTVIAVVLGLALCFLRMARLDRKSTRLNSSH